MYLFAFDIQKKKKKKKKSSHTKKDSVLFKWQPLFPLLVCDMHSLPLGGPRDLCAEARIQRG